MAYLDGRERDRPFFAYLAFQAIHIPVQAPREFTDRYEGVFSDGWDAIRERRFERAGQLGLAPPGAAPPSRHLALRSWGDPTVDPRFRFSMSQNGYHADPERAGEPGYAAGMMRGRCSVREAE